jgi:hypothetical protein
MSEKIILLDDLKEYDKLLKEEVVTSSEDTTAEELQKVNVNWADLAGEDLSGRTIYFDTTKGYYDTGVAVTVLVTTSNGYTLEVGSPPDFYLAKDGSRLETLYKYGGGWLLTEYTLPADFGVITSAGGNRTAEECIGALNKLCPSVEMPVKTKKVKIHIKDVDLVVPKETNQTIATQEWANVIFSNKIKWSPELISKQKDLSGWTLKFDTNTYYGYENIPGKKWFISGVSIKSSGGYELEIGGPPDIYLKKNGVNVSRVWEFTSSDAPGVWHLSELSLPEDFGYIVSATTASDGNLYEALNIMCPNGFENVAGRDIDLSTYVDPMFNGDVTVLTFKTNADNQLITLNNPDSTKIDWGDGSIQNVTTYTEVSHVYEKTGTYLCKFYGLTETIAPCFLTSGKDCLTKVILGNSVSILGYSAFIGCANLAEVKLSKSLNLPAPNVFSGCSSLTEITIPKAVVQLGTDYFANCTRLKTVIFEDPNENLTSVSDYGQTYYDNWFAGCTALEKIIVPSNKVEACKAAWKPVADKIDSVAYLSDIPEVADTNNFVTLDGDQTISGNKTFSSNIQFGSVDVDATTPPVTVNSTYGYIALGEVDLNSYATKLTFSERGANVDYFGKYIKYPYYNYTLNLPEPQSDQTHTLATQEWVQANTLSDLNLENGSAPGSVIISDIQTADWNIARPQANGVGAIALTGQRGDKDPSTLDPTDDRISEARGLQSFVVGPGNLAAGDWTAVSGKDNTVYSNRAFVSGGANLTGEVDGDGNLIFEATNVGRFNAIFGNNNTFKSSNTLKESNLIAGGSNTVDTERSIVVGYSNNVSGYYNAVFGLGNIVNADRSLIGGEKNTINGAYHLAAGSNNEVSGQFNITSGQDNNNAGWSSAAIGKGLVVGKGYTGQTILGQYNDNKSNTVLEIGWGDPDDRKNIFEVYKDGVVKTEKGILSTEEYVRNYTDNAVAAPKTKLNIGTNNTDTDADNSLTVGQHSLNRGAKSAAIGWDAYVGYDSSGNPTSTKPTGAVALNWSRANGDYSLSAGYDTEVNHSWSTSLNNKTKTGASAQTVVGSYNAAKDNTAFEVGNGTASDRKNAFEVLKDGRAKVQSAPIDNDDVVRLADMNKAVEEKIAEASVKNAVKITKYINQGGSYNQTLEVAPSEELPGNISLYQNGVEIAVDGPTTKNSFEFKLSPSQKALLEDNLTLQSIKFKDTLTAAQFNSPAIKNNGCISLSFSFEDRPSPTYLPITVVVSNDGSLAAQGSAWYSINTENFELTINFDNYISVANSHSDEQYILNGYLIIPLTLDNKEFTLSYSNGNIYLSKYITEEYKIVTKPLYQSDCRNLTITSPTGAPAYLQIKGDSSGGSNIASTTFEPITYDITSNARATLMYEGLPLSLLD